MANKKIVKQRKPKYSAVERVEYHRNRLKSGKVTKNQKAYSRNWLEGFNDEHASNNLQAAKKELNQRKLYVSAKESEIANIRKELRDVKLLNKTVFGGYINGLKVRLNQNK